MTWLAMRPSSLTAQPAGRIYLRDMVITTVTTSPTNATAQFQFRDTDVFAGGVDPNNPYESYRWLLTGVPSDYDIRAVVLTGQSYNIGNMSASGGWGNMNVWRGAGHTQSIVAGTRTSTHRIDIRDASTLDTLASAIFTVTATRNP